MVIRATASMVGAHRMRLAAGQVDHLVRTQDGGAAVGIEGNFSFQAQQRHFSLDPVFGQRLLLRQHQPDQLHVIGLDQRDRREVRDVVFAALKCDAFAGSCMLQGHGDLLDYFFKCLRHPAQPVHQRGGVLESLRELGHQFFRGVDVEFDLDPDEIALELQVFDQRMVRVEPFGGRCSLSSWVRSP
jgi:hypothetical protein